MSLDFNDPYAREVALLWLEQSAPCGMKRALTKLDVQLEGLGPIMLGEALHSYLVSRADLERRIPVDQSDLSHARLEPCPGPDSLSAIAWPSHLQAPCRSPGSRSPGSSAQVRYHALRLARRLRIPVQPAQLLVATNDADVWTHAGRLGAATGHRYAVGNGTDFGPRRRLSNLVDIVGCYLTLVDLGPLRPSILTLAKRSNHCACCWKSSMATSFGKV